MNKLDRCTKEELNKIVKESNSYSECLKKLNYSKSGDSVKLLKNYIKTLAIDISHFTKSNTPKKRTAENVFIQNSNADQRTLRRFYTKGRYTKYECAICGQLPEWQNKPLTLILDHINGHNNDNRLKNLRWVCPNCNQQLPTTNGKNINNKNKYSSE